MPKKSEVSLFAGLAMFAYGIAILGLYPLQFLIWVVLVPGVLIGSVVGGAVCLEAGFGLPLVWAVLIMVVLVAAGARLFIRSRSAD